jgi:hypothetical protein
VAALARTADDASSRTADALRRACGQGCGEAWEGQGQRISEGALATLVGGSAQGCVEAAGLERRHAQDLVGGDVADLGVAWSWLRSLLYGCAQGEAGAGHGWLAGVGQAVVERLAGDGAAVV